MGWDTFWQDGKLVYQSDILLWCSSSSRQGETFSEVMKWLVCDSFKTKGSKMNERVIQLIQFVLYGISYVYRHQSTYINLYSHNIFWHMWNLRSPNTWHSKYMMWKQTQAIKARHCMSHVLWTYLVIYYST